MWLLENKIAYVAHVVFLPDSTFPNGTNSPYKLVRKNLIEKWTNDMEIQFIVLPQMEDKQLESYSTSLARKKRPIRIYNFHLADWQILRLMQSKLSRV